MKRSTISSKEQACHALTALLSPPHADHVAAFGQRLKTLRNQAGLTRKDLAARAGMSPHHLNKVERGASGPSFGAIHALAKALGVDPGFFFTGPDQTGLTSASLEPLPSISRISRPELVTRFGLLAVDCEAGRILLSPPLSSLLGLDRAWQDIPLDIFLERHAAPADRAGLRLNMNSMAAGTPVPAREVGLLSASGTRVVVIFQEVFRLNDHSPLGEERLIASQRLAEQAWALVVDVTALDAEWRDQATAQTRQAVQIEQLIKEQERLTLGLRQESHARRQAERLLQDAQQLLRGVVHSAGDALIILEPDLSVLDGNSELHRLCQGKCDPEKHCRMSDLLDAKTLRRLKELASQALKTGFLTHGNMRIDDHALELTLYPVLDANKKPQRLVLWMHDATKTSLQRDELRKQRLLLEKAEQMARLGSWEWDIEADVFRMSPNWFAIHGSHPRMLTAAELFPMAHPDDVPTIQDSFQKVLDGEPEYRIEHRIIRQDTGEARWISAWGEVVRNETGRPVKMFGVCQDVTEIRQGMAMV